MSSLVRTLACVALAVGADMAAHVSAVADDRVARNAQWAEAAARQAQEAQRRQREARLRWESERRRSAAHARMPNTLYASTLSSQAKADLSCPALVDEDARRLYRGFLEGRRGTSKPLTASDVESGKSSRNAGINVFPVQRQGSSSSPPWQSASAPKADGLSHLIQASAWAPAAYRSKSATEGSQHVYLFPSASEPLREGFVRVINHSTEAGEVTIDPVDDSGRQFDTITLSIDASETVHFNSGDLETGNEGKGLSGSTGSGQGDWRLAFSSELDIEVLSYIRTEDGFLTAMHDVAPVEDDIHQVAIFNPGSNRNQVSRLRLINPTDATAEVTIRGTDDKGMPGSGEVSLSLDAGTAREITAEQLESGGTGLAGMLGDGSGKWRLQVESEQAVVAMSLLESPTDHLTNLSTVPELAEDGVHGVPLFPAAGDDSGRQGFVRAINRSDTAGEIHIKAYDETERDYEPVMLTIGGNEVVHFNSDDLEQGSPQKGLSGGTGAGEGDWRLELTSDLQIEVLSYIRTTDGFLTAMHDVAPSAGNRHRVAVFNPGSNRNQESLLRLVNPGEAPAEVTIAGVDDRGAPGDGEVTLSVPGGGLRTVGAWELESGADRLTGMLGDGSGKWQLTIASDLPVVAMSLLKSPTGHLTNLSTAPVRGARGGAAQEPQTAEAVFQQLISGPIVQSKCITCHVEGGASGNTRLVFVTDDNPDHEAINLQVFQDFLAEVDDGASYMLNKIQGALGHGGGIQVAAGTDEYANMERFLTLLGEDVGPVALTPETLFDGAEMESARNTLRRAAIIFAGRIPTEEEYESTESGGLASLRAAIRVLMEGPEFHEFLVRGANDRLLTDRDGTIIDASATDEFVDFSNLYYEKATSGISYEELYWWYKDVQYGIRRAPLELIARVAKNDLPYSEILTADYTMANPMAAEAYGSQSQFSNPSDVHEFKPSAIVSYYRDGPSKVAEYSLEFGTQVTNPGELATKYPHAGILNTTVFLLRYPTTATNRNRARSRWTYYHFLGLDVEKSASRTTDPDALADRDNPTLSNPACTVCHRVLDPVAGAFQNYGDVGLYRDQQGGLDSLDQFYKEEFTVAQETLEVVAPRDDPHVVSMTAHLTGGNRGKVRLRLHPRFDPPRPEGSEIWWHMGIDHVRVRDANGNIVQHLELQGHVEEMELCGPTDQPDEYYGPWFCNQDVLLDVPAPGNYEVELVLWFDGENREGDATDRRRLLDVLLGGYVEGDTWYRDMRVPGFAGRSAPNPDDSVRWLAAQIVADDRFSESTVRFWWPAIMGSEVAEPPEDKGDADFNAKLIASAAQDAEIARLARGFRQGFGGGRPYDLKDLLVEITLSRWFRAESVEARNAVQMTALRDAGARRLLTPEELGRKTGALTGFQLGRELQRRWHDPSQRTRHELSGPFNLLYGGIDSDGVTERARDFTSVMAGVAERYAVQASCPIIMRELYLLPDGQRRLFDGIERTDSPVSEFGDSFDVEAGSWVDRETFAIEGALSAGAYTVALAFVNDHWEEEADRNLRVDSVVVSDAASGRTVATVELEDIDSQECGRPDYNDATERNDHRIFSSECRVAIPVEIPIDGTYRVEVVAWADQAGEDLAVLDVVVESNVETSLGARKIRSKLADLHEKLLGVEATTDSADVEAAYRLFVDVWERRRTSSDGGSFDGWWCPWSSDRNYFDGILEDPILKRANGDSEWDNDRVDEYFSGFDFQDPNHMAWTWEVVLAYLLTDFRYLYL